MDKLTMAKFEGSLTTNDVINALLSSNVNGYEAETLPELYEHLVKCPYCPLESKCVKLAKALEDHGYSPYCHEVLSIMLGEKHINELI